MRSLIWGLILLCIPCVGHASDDAPQLKELSKKAKDIEEKYRMEERKLFDIDGKIYKIEEKIAQVKKDIEAKQEQSTYLETQLNHYESAESRHKENLRNNWVGLYKGSLFDMVDLYCSHEEYTGYLNSIIERQYEVLKEYNVIRTKIQQARQRFDVVAGELKRDLKKLENTTQELSRQRKEKAKMLASLKRTSNKYQDRMRQILGRIEAQKRQKELASGSIFKKKGKLPWPVKGKIVRSFGPFQVKGVAQRSQGIDIETGEGTPVKSIYEGKVVFVNWMNGYGNTIIVDHGGGYYSVYGHLKKIDKAMGDKVSAKDTIARVGQSGDVIRPTLHFELRFHDKPQDPHTWLARE
jgi:septal ring factor EnvC (AmiA/AmiB activator)